MTANDHDFKEIGRQMSCPDGKLGIKVADTMHQSNIGMTLSAVDCLHIQDNDKVLELGHGNCGHLQNVLDTAQQVRYYGLEVSKTMYHEAQKQAVDNNLVEFQIYNGNVLPYSDNFFDKLFTVNTIYFWHNPVKTLQEMYRVLKVNGLCVIAYANSDFMTSLPFVGDDFELYNHDKVKQLVAQLPFICVDIIERQEQYLNTLGEPVDRTYTLVMLIKN